MTTMETNELAFQRQELADEQLPEHLTTPRTQRSKKTHICETCGKTFDWISHLKRHMKIHFGVKEHECLDCGKKFLLKSQLSQHAVVHGEKNYSCHKCGRRFVRPSDLQTHLRKKIPCTTQNQVDVRVENIQRRRGTTVSNGAPTNNTQIPNEVKIGEGNNVPCSSKIVELPSPPSELTDNVTTLKCLICEKLTQLKSNLICQFKPHNIGMRYICHRCDTNLEASNDLDEYFRKSAIIMHNW